MLDDVLTFRHTISTPINGTLIRRGWYYGPTFRQKPYHAPPMAAPIPYAPPLPWHRRRRTQTIIVRLVIIAAILCGTGWLFRFAQQLQFLGQQRQWMNYTLPADKIVLAQGTPDAIQLLKMPGYFPLAGGASARRAPEWSCKRSDLSHPFIHALHAAGHAQRLVSIVAEPNYNQGDGRKLALFAYTEIPAGFEPGAQPQDACTVYNIGAGHLLLPIQNSLRLFAGQPDPADESHFTLRAEIDGKPILIDGYLMSNDTVKLEPRK